MSDFQQYIIIYLAAFAIVGLLPVTYLFSKKRYAIRHTERTVLIRVIIYLMFGFLVPVIVLLTPIVLYEPVRQGLEGFNWLIMLTLVIVNLPIWMLLYRVLNDVFNQED